MTPEAAREKTILLSALAQEAGRQVCGKDLLSLSVGSAFYPQDGPGVEHLLAEADRKMYAASNFITSTPNWRRLAERSILVRLPRTRT
jgi:GGDEF domain-containing protein